MQTTRQKISVFKHQMSEKLAGNWYQLVRASERRAAVKNIKEKTPFVVGVTGSCGKSTTVMLVNRILSKAYGQDVQMGYSSNSQRSVYRTFRKLVKNNQTVVQEISAAGGSGYLDYLVRDIPTNIAVLTAIGTDHAKAFPSSHDIVLEKEKILASLVPGGTACLNIDDEHIAQIAERANKDVKQITVSCERDADIRAHIRSADWKRQLSFDVTVEGHTHFVQTKFVGTIALHNVLLAIAVVHAMGLAIEPAIKVLAEMGSIENRGNIQQTQDGQSFLLDSYKAPLWSTQLFINDLENIRNGPMIMVLGHLSDTGNGGAQKYRQTLNRALPHVDLLIGIGRCYSSAQRIKKADPTANVLACETIDDVLAAIAPHPDALIILKSAKNAKIWRIFAAKDAPVSCKVQLCSLETECKNCKLLRA
ncbi:MAG: UDP-N-acetylmuramoyl-tripeptide--D-alanyl-D-alanine ligase [Maritalea sp.]